MTFEEYLTAKKIDSKDFYSNERNLWESWKSEFQQMHPNSFTAQKLYLINPIRRKYPLREATPEKSEPLPETGKTAKPVIKAVKPVFKPKPKS